MLPIVIFPALLRTVAPSGDPHGRLRSPSGEHPRCPTRSGARIDIQGGIALERKCALVRLTLVGLASISNSARLMYALPVDVARLKRLIHINSRWLPCRTTRLFHADRIIDSLVRCSLPHRLHLWMVLARTLLHNLPAARFPRDRWTPTSAWCLDT